MTQLLCYRCDAWAGRVLGCVLVAREPESLCACVYHLATQPQQRGVTASRVGDGQQDNDSDPRRLRVLPQYAGWFLKATVVPVRADGVQVGACAAAAWTHATSAAAGVMRLLRLTSWLHVCPATTAVAARATRSRRNRFAYGPKRHIRSDRSCPSKTKPRGGGTLRPARS